METTTPNKSIEQRVAETVLERKSEVLTLDGVDYPIAPPTLATIIMTSELAATLPKINPEGEDLLHEVLRSARHCRTLGKITAVLILGAKRVQENRLVPRSEGQTEKRSYFSRIFRSARQNRADRKMISEADKLAEIVLNELAPSTLQAILTRRLIDMQIADFFALTTSLTTANQIKPTREVGEATASGE